MAALRSAPNGCSTLSTEWLLLGQFSGRAIVPLDEVRAAFFGHLDTSKLIRKINDGTIPLPTMRLDGSSNKSARGVHVGDLARYLDERRAVAQAEARALAGEARAS